MNTTKRSISTGAEELIDLYFPVLDHGFVALKDYMGTDEDIERAARVSYGAGTRKTSQTRGLLRYLGRHRHSSPTEMVEMRFHLSMPIFCARQWVRHRTANQNEISGRYSLLPMLFYSPNKEEFSFQSTTNKQGRQDNVDNQRTDFLYKSAIGSWNDLRKQSKRLYEDLTVEDVARELARIDLPLSTYTQFYWKMDLHNLFHFLSLRCDEHTQIETRQFANIIAGMVKQIAPLAFEAWFDYNFCGVHFSRMEMNFIRQFFGQSENTIYSLPNNGKYNSESLERNYKLSAREVKELFTKLQQPQTINFNLDLSSAKDANYFEQKMLEAVPKVDKNG